MVREKHAAVADIAPHTLEERVEQVRTRRLSSIVLKEQELMHRLSLKLENMERIKHQLETQRSARDGNGLRRLWITVHFACAYYLKLRAACFRRNPDADGQKAMLYVSFPLPPSLHVV